MLKDDYNELKYKTRAIIFVFNKGDYDAELEEVRKTARRAAKRPDTRLAMVTDPKLIKKYKQGTGWFGDASLNTFIMKRYDGEIFVFNLIGEEQFIGSVYSWLMKKKVKEVEEMSKQIMAPYQDIG